MGWEELVGLMHSSKRRVLNLRGNPQQLAVIKAERTAREKAKAERLQAEARALANRKEARKADLERQRAAIVLPPSALYVLRDPNTGCVRYVGQTTNPSVRLKMHTVNPGKPVRGWIDSLGGKAPIMQVLAWYPFDSIIAAENQCIALCLEHGIALLNSSFEINRGRAHPLGK